ncbi:MAG: ABC transporter permease [Desulfobia sp.]
MIRLEAVIWKELLLLRRDRAGMLILFLMPAVLVVVITLVQQNVLKIMGETSTSILVVDRDGQGLGVLFQKRLVESGRVRLISRPGRGDTAEQRALEKVAEGDFQLCLLIPAGTSNNVAERAEKLVRGVMEKGESYSASDLPGLPVYFDPTVSPGFRRNMLIIFRLVLLEYEVREKIEAFSAALKSGFQKAGAAVPDFMGHMAADDPNWGTRPLVRLEERAASARGVLQIPDAVQQNVPAWSLFGMFFVVVPLAGSLLRERQSGVWIRLLSMPVSPFTLLSGKVAAYLLICFCQFGLIVVLGRFLLPWLGTAPFTIEPGVAAAVLLVVLGSSLAAAGFGILLGSVCRSFEQASMFGAVSVVLGAAVGGVMVPVYAMPDFMQGLSVISPLGWSLAAFHDILVRQQDLLSIGRELGLLFSFFAAAMLLALAALFSRK